MESLQVATNAALCAEILICDFVVVLFSKGEVEMSTRGVEKLRALCNLLIRQNRDGGLHSPMLNRAVAVRTAQDILALTRLRPSRPWADSDALDVLVSELRRTASERRLTAEIRTLALKRLSWIELGEPALGNEPTDELIRKLVASKIGSHHRKG
jgi:hypothetical protein